MALQKHIIIRNQVPDSLEDLSIDGKRMMQVVSNLLSNAIKFSDLNSQVTVSARLSDESMLVTVEDTGPGIPSEYLDLLFDPEIFRFVKDIWLAQEYWFFLKIIKMII